MWNWLHCNQECYHSHDMYWLFKSILYFLQAFVIVFILSGACLLLLHFNISSGINSVSDTCKLGYFIIIKLLVCNSTTADTIIPHSTILTEPYNILLHSNTEHVLLNCVIILTKALTQNCRCNKFSIWFFIFNKEWHILTYILSLSTISTTSQ